MSLPGKFRVEVTRARESSPADAVWAGKIVCGAYEFDVREE